MLGGVRVAIVLYTSCTVRRDINLQIVVRGRGEHEIIQSNKTL